MRLILEFSNTLSSIITTDDGILIFLIFDLLNACLAISVTGELLYVSGIPSVFTVSVSLPIRFKSGLIIIHRKIYFDIWLFIFHNYLS